MLEQHQLTQRIFAAIRSLLEEKRLLFKRLNEVRDRGLAKNMTPIRVFIIYTHCVFAFAQLP